MDRDAVGKLCEEWIDQDPKRAVAWYLAKFGPVINTDSAREMSQDYLNDKTRYADAVHASASRLAGMVYSSLLEIPDPGKKVTFLAGGGGSGKSYALRMLNCGTDEIVFDGTLSNYERACERIDAALSAGAQVSVVYVNRDAIHALAGKNGALDRAVLEGRTVPIEEMASAHAGAAETIRKIASTYGPRVDITVINNTGVKASKGTLADVPVYDQTNLLRRMKYAIEEAHVEGRISDDLYHAFRARRLYGGQDASVASALPGSPGRGGGEGARTSGIGARDGARQEPQAPVALNPEYLERMRQGSLTPSSRRSL